MPARSNAALAGLEAADRGSPRRRGARDAAQQLLGTKRRLSLPWPALHGPEGLRGFAHLTAMNRGTR